jgi:hypothetical protein
VELLRSVGTLEVPKDRDETEIGRRHGEVLELFEHRGLADSPRTEQPQPVAVATQDIIDHRRPAVEVLPPYPLADHERDRIVGDATGPILQRRVYRRRRTSVGRRGFDLGDQAIATLRDRFDEPRVLGVVAEGPSQARDRTGNDRLGDEEIRPDGVRDVVLRHDPAGVPRQVDEDVHQLGLDLDLAISAGEPVEARLNEPFASAKVRCRPLVFIHVEAFYPGHHSRTVRG